MSVEKFIPKLWSARLLYKFDKEMVYGNLVNRDYEGEISNAGDTVNIQTIGEVTIKDYAANTDIDAPETLSGTQKQLIIDQQKYYNMQIDDVDKAQANVTLMDKALMRAGYAMADTIDQYIASFYSDIPSANSIGSDGTPIDIDKDNAYDQIVDLGVILDDNNVPKEGRWVVIPNWYKGMLLKDSRFTRDVEKTMRKGYMGEADGMSVYTSNNVPNTTKTKYKVIAGTNASISMAMQIVKNVAYSPEKRFGDAMKGLNVYGVKNLLPEGLALLTCNKK